MRIKTVRINPSGDKWNVYIERRDTQHTDAMTSPSAMGFYHAPEEMADKVATRKLIRTMIRSHENVIEETIKSRTSLEKLLKEYS